MKNHYFLDFETTGLNQYHDEVIEIGIKKFGGYEYTTLVVQGMKMAFIISMCQKRLQGSLYYR